jgi:hypothetical protein
MRKLLKGNQIAVYADSEFSYRPLMLHKEMKKSGSIVQSNNEKMLMQHPEMQGHQIPLDFETWLPFAAKPYHISPNVKDYVLVPVIIMPSDLPNRNGVGFPLRELVKFMPDYGVQAYKTWKGQPTHLEHQNQDVTKAYGVIVDAFMKPMKTHGQGKLWKLMLLLAFDRSKHPELTSRIETGEVNSYSMGAFVDGYTCSACGAELGGCHHLDPKQQGQFYIQNGTLIFKNVRGIKGFETSAVSDPAYVSAISDEIKIL